MGLTRDRQVGSASCDRQSATQGCCGKYGWPESESDFPVVARPLSLRVQHVRCEPCLDFSRMACQEDSLRNGGQCQKDIDSPVNMLVDTVTSIQKEMAILREENSLLRTPATLQVVQVPRRAALTTTRVSRFNGTTSWEQCHQVFEAIVQSNGWDSDTAALQLFSHLVGDALNVAHLIPLTQRLSRSGLVDALTAHYGSPGRLADYRRQFEKTTRTENLAIFATALETLAVKAFGDMGQTAQLRLIRDRFIAGHGNCDLRRHLDSVAPETPIRDIVDRCRVWESHTDPASSRLT